MIQIARFRTSEPQSAFVEMAAIRPSAGMKLARRVLAHIVHARDIAQKARPVATEPLAGRQGRIATGTRPLIIATAHDEIAARLAYDWLGMGRAAFPAEGVASHAAHDGTPSNRAADPLRSRQRAASLGSYRPRRKPALRREARPASSGEMTMALTAFYSE